MKKIKEIWASLFIPKNTPYCHHKFKKSKKYGTCAKPCRYWEIIYTSDNKPVEYCKLLNQILDIQDQVKDCGINDVFGRKI